jgi:hypothetical protein
MDQVPNYYDTPLVDSMRVEIQTLHPEDGNWIKGTIYDVEFKGFYLFVSDIPRKELHGGTGLVPNFLEHKKRIPNLKNNYCWWVCKRYNEYPIRPIPVDLDEDDDDCL